MATTPITCHVLDTTTGRPAPSIAVTLKLLTPSSSAATFHGKTDADGRIKSWSSTSEASIGGLIAGATTATGELMLWSLSFDSGSYFGPGKTFFPEVEIRISVPGGSGQHYHVPLLLGPYSYTTYRGS